MKNLFQLILYLLAFVIAETFSMWGQYSMLNKKNPSMWSSLLYALPFAWTNWFFMTIAVGLGHKYNLVTPTQDIFMLIITQFGLVILINKYYLGQDFHMSDIIAFIMILVGFALSHMHIISKYLNIPIPKEKNNEEQIKDEDKVDDEENEGE
jgi:hypothetical protein